MTTKRRKATDRQTSIVRVWRELERSSPKGMTLHQALAGTAKLFRGPITEVIEALEVYGLAMKKRAGQR